MDNISTQNDLAAIARQAMIDRGLEPDFPSPSLAQLNGIHGPARLAPNAVRDLRHLPWCSIDNDDSRDLDQLTVAERLGDGRARAYVAIADVDAVVSAGSPIDRHAEANTTSVYTAAKIFPMLPEKLSTDLTSLNQDADRLSLVVAMVVAPDGAVQESEVYRALVRNQAKLAYSAVAAWLDGQGPQPQAIARAAGLAENLHLQDEIAKTLKAVRHQHGALEFQSLEARAVMEGDRVVDLRLETQNRAQDLIADFMIAANGATARFLAERGLPTLQRVVRSPERWERIRQVAQGFGTTLPESPDSVALASFLTARRQADTLRFPDLSLTIVKLMGAGEYVVQAPGQTSPGHFGLAVSAYTHSTAPNRRFPDLLTQRLLKAALANGAAPYNLEQLNELADHCTQQEDAAKKVERQVRKSAAAQLLQHRIGEAFDAIVTGSSEKGTWVRALKPPVEGKLVEGERSVQVGDKIRIQLRGVNVRQGFIDFKKI